MRIETKYNIGDTIWISDGEKPYSHTVVGIWVRIAADGKMHISYKSRISGVHKFVNEGHCCKSYEECEELINRTEEERKLRRIKR